MKINLYLLEVLEIIPDIDFEHSRSFENDLGHSRKIWDIQE